MFLFLSFKFNALKLSQKLWFDDLYLSGYHIIKDHVSCRNENFHRRTFRGCSLITLAWLGDVNWRSGTHSFWFAFPTSLVFVCQVIMWLHHVTCRNNSISFWYVFPPRLVIIGFMLVALWCFRFVIWSRDQKSCHR